MSLYGQAAGRVIWSYSSTANLADIEDLVNAGVIFVGIANNWRAYTDVPGGPDYNNSITLNDGTVLYYNRGVFAAAPGGIVCGSLLDLAAGTPSPRSGRGPRVDIWAPSRVAASSFYAGENPDGTGLGYNGDSQLGNPSSTGYLPSIKNVRDSRNSNYYVVKSTDGTSFSAPQVAGLIGLWAELKPNLTPAQALGLLQSQGQSNGVNSTSSNYYDPTGIAGAQNLTLGFLPPTFAINTNKLSYANGEIITYTITTTNVPDGSTLYLTYSGSAFNTDFVDGLSETAVVINSNSATVTRTINSNRVNINSTASLKTGGYTGTIQATSTITINNVISGTLTNFLNSYQSDFGYLNILSAADLTAAGSAYALPAAISTTQISVASYGASGNGTDQTTAIQAALNAGAGKTVYFPAGTYLVSSTLTVPANTRLLGDSVLQNTVIKATSALTASSSMFTSTGNNVYFQKIIFDGNNNSGRTIALLSFNGNRYLYLIQCIIQNTSFMGMAAGSCRDVRVWGSKFESCGIFGSAGDLQPVSSPAFWTDTIAGIPSQDVYIEKCLFLNNRWSAAYFMPTGGIFKDNLLVNNLESGVFSNENANSLLIENNYIYKQTRRNISSSGLELGGNNHTVRNNTIHNCGADGISLSDVSGCTVEYNTCYDNGVETTYAAYFLAAGITLASLSNRAINATLNTIRYNRCFNTTGNTSQPIGIFFYRAPNSRTIDNCTITNNNNYNNTLSQIRDHQNNSVGGTTTISNNISNSASTTEGATSISGTVQNIFNASVKTFSISASPTTGQFGTVINYTITTSNVPNGITLYLKETGSASATDFQWIQNSVTINNNTATISRTVGNLTTAKTSILTLLEGSFSGPSRATTSVNLSAVSQTYNVYPSTTVVGESKSIVFTVSTTGVSNGTVLYYKITGTVSANDFTDNLITGSVTIGSNGRGQITKTITTDSISDNNETIVMEIYTNSSFSTRVATTAGSYSIFTKDQNAFYLLSSSTGVVNENNQTITFTLNTANIPPGSLIPYSITGISSSDLVGSPSLTGNFVVSDPTSSKSNINDLGGWVFYPNREIQTSAGTDVVSVYIRGSEVIISDGIFWNPACPTGSVLKRISDGYKALGYRTGVTLTPVVFTHTFPGTEGSTKTEAFISNEIVNSGLDFIAITPYLWPANASVSILNNSVYWDATRLYNWASSTVSRYSSLNIQTKIILQGFRYLSQTYSDVNNYNNNLLSISNIDEFVVFGLEDAPDFTGLSDPVSLFNDLTDSIYTSISFVTNPDLITEGTETMVMTITGQAVDKNNTLLPLTQTPLTLQASVSILDTSSAPVATYNLTRSVATINEGQSVTITLATTNVAAGTSVPWTVTGISAGDLSSGSLTGNFIVGTTDTASFTLSNDSLTEGTETLTLTLNGRAESISVTVLDTSTTPIPVYTLTNNATNNRVNEGSSVIFTLATTNVSNGTSIPWTVTGISAGDLSSGSLTGNFIVGTTDTASFTLSNDATSEGTERLTLTLNGLPVSSFVDVIDTSTSPSSPTFTLTNNVNSPINEGTTVVFTLTTTNISSGTSVPWEIRGIGTYPTDTDDFFNTPATGNFVINAAGVATASVTVKQDLKTEQTERFRFRLINNVAIYNDIDITDSSFPASTYTLTADKSSVNEGDDLTIFLVQSPYASQDVIQSYTVSGITSADLDLNFSSPLSGTFNLQSFGSDGRDSKTFRIKADQLTDAGESFTLTLTGIGRSESITVPINDTSTTPGVVYSLSTDAAGDSVNEGSSVTFFLGTTGVGSGVTLGYSVTGINAADLSSGSLTGNFTTNANGGASVTFGLSNDLKLEGNETLTLSLNNGGATKSVTVVDTSFPTYSLTGNPTVSEGSSVTVTLTTTGLNDGDLVPYVVTGINSADLSAGSLSGNFIINPTGSTPGIATISFTLANDLRTEGLENLIVSLVNGLATPLVITVIDTSVTPPTVPSYSLSASSYSVNEGGSVAIILATTNVAAGTTIPYTITGVSTSDINGASLTGNFTANASGGASLVLSITADSLTEGAETLRLAINGTSEYVDIGIVDTSLTPSPVLPSYSLTANSATLREGESIVIILSTTNLGVGVAVPYNITGVSQSDINRPLSGGSFLLNSAGKASVTLNAISDFTTEGIETLRLTIFGTSTFIDIPIVDTSTGFPTYSLTANTLFNNEGNTLVIILTTTSLPTGTNVPYTIFGVGPGDIGGASLTGNFTTNAAGAASLVLSITADGLLEGSEFLNVSLDGRTEFVTVFITDTSKPAESFSLITPATIVTEGSTVNITLSTTGIIQNTIIPYSISGTTDSVDYSNISSGNFVINEYGNSTISVTFNRDFEVEGTETFIVTLTNRPQTNITIFVNDYSFQTIVPANFKEVLPVVVEPGQIILPPPSNTTSIENLGDTDNRPSSIVQQLIPEFTRGGI